MRVVVLLIVLAACGDDAQTSPDAGVDAPADAAPDADPCACSLGAVVTVGPVVNIGTSELSGLAASRRLPGLYWTHADSGGTATIYSLHDDASVAGTLTVTGATATDWEDIAVGPCTDTPTTSCIYVADTGDNAFARTMVSLYEVVEPATVPAGAVPVTAKRWDIQYPDGAKNVEAVVIDSRDGLTYAFTKVDSGFASVYTLPRMDGTIGTAAFIAHILPPSGTDRRITSADVFADDCGVKLLIRTYTGLFEITGPADMPMATLVTRPLVAVPVATEPQGEAVAFAPDGRRYFTVSEGGSPNLYAVSCSPE